MQALLPVPGDIVWIRQQRWRVERAWRDRHVVRLDVAARDQRMTFLSPFDRAIAPGGRRAPARVRPQRAAAGLAHLLARVPDWRLPLAALDAGIEVLPHQLSAVLAVIKGHSRLLLADEVGLGKTIQAGLVIAEIARREPSPRMLIIVPAALRDQWADELASRFRIAATMADRSSLETLARAGAFGDNPWRRSGVWLTSPDYLKQRHVLESLPLDPWDVVVIDEAHVVCGDSDRFETCQSIVKRARRVLLLTATPHSGDEERFNRLLELGNHGGRASGGHGLLTFRRTRSSLGMPVTRRVRWHFVNPSAAESRALAALAAFERAVVASSREDPGGSALLLLSVFRKRALSTFAAFSSTLSRRLAWLGETPEEPGLDWMQPRFAFDDVPDEAAEEERAGLLARTGIDPGRERALLRRLRQLADAAARADSKVARLTSLICRTTEPVVVFTEFIDSLIALERHLHRSRPIATLHGGQDLVERRQNLKRFLDGSASVLLATDVASQGLNLQARARWVISLELPWNPARLEQRVGRIDRFGQTRTPHMTLLVARHPAESGLLMHVAKRALSARQSFSEDALPAVPSESSLRLALLRCLPAPEPGAVSRQTVAQVPLATVTRRHRLAHAVASQLRRRRELASHWRAPSDDAPRPTWTRRRVGCQQSFSHIVVCSVPIRNGRDELVERLVLAGTVDPACFTSHRDLNHVAQAIRRCAGRHINRIVRKRSWLLGAASARAVERELAIGGFIREEEFPPEIQSGLFDLRSSRDSDRIREDCERLASVSDRLISRWREGAMLRAGDAVIEILWLARR